MSKGFECSPFELIMSNMAEIYRTKSLNAGYLIKGPILSSSADEMDAIIRFRSRHYNASKSYLHSSTQIELDEKIQSDARSQHFVLTRSDEIVGCARLTPAPFEFGELSTSLQNLAPAYSRYLELSRLVVDPVASKDRITSAFIFFILHSAISSNNKNEGIIALCQGAPRKIFERYGMHRQSSEDYIIADRDNNIYSLLIGPWPEFVPRLMNFMQRDLQNTFSSN